MNKLCQLFYSREIDLYCYFYLQQNKKDQKGGIKNGFLSGLNI